MNVPQSYIASSKKYIEEVISGVKMVGELEKLAVHRHIDDINYSLTLGIYFDERAALKAFSFFPLLRHSKGKFSGKPFTLEPWQCFIIYSLFGWKRSNGTRRFRKSYIEVARKNGKTTLAAAIALILMIFDSEAGAEVYTAATKYAQAKICWDEARNMIRSSPALSKYITAYERALVMESTLSKMEPLASDSGKLDGLNPHGNICDELHAWKTDDLYNVLTSATGAREQPLTFAITTAGLNKNYPCFRMRNVYIEILRGIKKQEDTFVQIFTIDKTDDWNDPACWVKANPNLGVSTSLEYLHQEYEAAVNHTGTKEINFRTKHLNQWVDAPEVWINDEMITGCNFGTNDSDLTGQSCYAGLDLASHIDINAFSLFFPDVNGKKIFKTYYWLPSEKVKENSDVIDYRSWMELDNFFVVPGSVIDIDRITSDIIGIIRKHDVLNLSFDPAKAYHGVIQGLEKEGLTWMLDEYSQSLRQMSEPTKYLEKLIYNREIDLMGDPVIRWMFRNVVIMRDTNDNIKPDKKRSQNKIDGVVSMINALGGYLSKNLINEFGSSSQTRVLNI